MPACSPELKNVCKATIMTIAGLIGKKLEEIITRVTVPVVTIKKKDTSYPLIYYIIN